MIVISSFFECINDDIKSCVSYFLLKVKQGTTATTHVIISIHARHCISSLHPTVITQDILRPLLRHTLPSLTLYPTQGLFKQSQQQLIPIRLRVQCPAANTQPWTATCSAMMTVVRTEKERGSGSQTV